jgi:hypothetical protein
MISEAVQEFFEEALGVSIGQIEDDEVTVPDALRELIRVESFADAGVLTDNDGLVLRFRDGSEWQLSLVQSR